MASGGGWRKSWKINPEAVSNFSDSTFLGKPLSHKGVVGSWELCSVPALAFGPWAEELP